MDISHKKMAEFLLLHFQKKNELNLLRVLRVIDLLRRGRSAYEKANVSCKTYFLWKSKNIIREKFNIYAGGHPQYEINNVLKSVFFCPPSVF